MPRRQALRLIAGAVAGAAVPTLLARPAQAAPSKPLKHTCDTQVGGGGWKFCSGTTEYCFPTCCPNERVCSTFTDLSTGAIHPCPTTSCCDPCNPFASTPDGRDGCMPGPVAAHCCPNDRKCGDDKCCPKGTRCLDPAEKRCSKLCISDVGEQDYDPQIECCTQRLGKQPKYPIQDLEVCTQKVQRRGTRTEVSMQMGRGCPSIGERAPRRYGRARFGNACDSHLRCYGQCGADKARCDHDFHLALDEECDAAYARNPRQRDNCKAIATAYADRAVYNGGLAGAALGDRFFEKLQKLVCQCCP